MPEWHGFFLPPASGISSSFSLRFCFDELVALLKQQVADLKEGAVKALRHLAPRVAGLGEH